MKHEHQDNELDTQQLSCVFAVAHLIKARVEIQAVMRDPTAIQLINTLIAHMGEKQLCDATTAVAAEAEVESAPDNAEEYFRQLADLAKKETQ